MVAVCDGFAVFLGLVLLLRAAPPETLLAADAAMSHDLITCDSNQM